MLSISLTNEKGGEGNDHDRQDFNSLIDQAELIDLSIADRSFTWSNLQYSLILTKLDSVLISADWENRFVSHSLHWPPCLDQHLTMLHYAWILENQWSLSAKSFDLRICDQKLQIVFLLLETIGRSRSSRLMPLTVSSPNLDGFGKLCGLGGKILWICP